MLKMTTTAIASDIHLVSNNIRIGIGLESYMRIILSIVNSIAEQNPRRINKNHIWLLQCIELTMVSLWQLNKGIWGRCSDKNKIVQADDQKGEYDE